MELNDIKDIWTRVVEEDHVKYTIAKKDIRAILRRKSKGLLSEISRELKIKRWFLGGIGLLSIVLSFVHLWDTDGDSIFYKVFSNSEMFALTLSLGVLILVLFINVVYSYREIKAYQQASASLRNTLETSIKLLRRIQFMAIYSDSFAVPILVAWYVYRKLFDQTFVFWDQRTLLVFLSGLGSFALIFLYSRFRQRKKFGSYIQQLQQLINDLEAIKK